MCAFHLLCSPSSYVNITIMQLLHAKILASQAPPRTTFTLFVHLTHRKTANPRVDSEEHRGSASSRLAGRVCLLRTVSAGFGPHSRAWMGTKSQTTGGDTTWPSPMKRNVLCSAQKNTYRHIWLVTSLWKHGELGRRVTIEIGANKCLPEVQIGHIQYHTM